MGLEKLSPIHPGEILNEEFLAPLSMNEGQLAKAIGVDKEMIHAIIHHETPISAEIALLLSRYFGTSAELWTGIQVQYDLEVAKDCMRDRLDAVKPRPMNGITPDAMLPPSSECQCGCGELPKSGSSFRPGHDQRALHKVIANEYGSVLEFLLHHGYASSR